MKEKKIFLTIAGSDPCGGAGVQADIKTADRIGLYPCSVITAITAQNSKSFSDLWPLEASEIKAQLDCVLSDFSPSAVKIGMLPTIGAVNVIASVLAETGLPNIILDPVLAPTLSNFSPDEGVAAAIIDQLFPMATLVTPNIPEMETLERIAGKPMEDLCEAFLTKGGHDSGEDSSDTLYWRADGMPLDAVPSSAFPTLNFNHSSLFNHDSILPQPVEPDHDLRSKTFRHRRIATANTHGTGCVLSSAVACYLALDHPLEKAVETAIKFTIEELRLSATCRLSEGDYGPALI